MDPTAAEAPLVDADHDVRRRLALVLDVDDLPVRRVDEDLDAAEVA